MIRHVRLSRLVLATVATAATATAGLAAADTASATTPVQRHPILVHPQVVEVSSTPGAVHFSCQDRPLDGSQGLRCYQPSQMQAAYGVTPLLNRGYDGSGRTIVIVDAYDSPYVADDLQIFDTEFGLPAADFEKVAPQGVPAFDVTDPNQVGWAEETTLDVLWAHAIAPGAKIELVQASSNQDQDIYNATKWAVDNNVGDVISQSFGEAETCVDPTLLKQEHAMFAQAAAKGMTVFASSGDSGASQSNCDGTGAIKAASSPASDPLVTGVGGTTLNADSSTGAYLGETAWTELVGCNPPAVDAADVNCSGGGFSTLYPRPEYQEAAVHNPRAGRGVPDVAYNAGVNGGVLTHCGICNVTLKLDPSYPAFFLFGGTSAGSPQWAALAAIGDQLAHRRMGPINPALYRLAQYRPAYAHVLHDVTTGNNDVAELGGAGYNARPGWDPVTGLGTPNAAFLLPALSRLTGSSYGDRAERR